MPRKVCVDDFESLRDAIRHWRKLVQEYGVLTGVGWKSRVDNGKLWVPNDLRKRQYFYFEKPSAKKRRKRYVQRIGRWRHERRVASEKGRRWQRLR